MGVTFVFGARGGRLLRAAGGLAELVQIHASRQAEQLVGELFWGSLCQRRPFVCWHRDRQTRHRGRDFPREIELRHGLIDRLRGMCRAERGHHHGIEIERHQRQAKAEQRGLGTVSYTHLTLPTSDLV